MRLKVVNDFLVGCDPEFAVVGSGRIRAARGYLPLGEGIGDDHGGVIGELRPDPSKSCWTLLNRIGLLIQKLAIIPDKCKAGAFVADGEREYGLGGHIHLDVSPFDGVLGGRGYGEKHPARVAALDLLTSVLEKLDILPSKECVLRRQQTEYGKYGAFRAQTSGSRYRTEYRTMPSWLTSPRVAYAALTGAKLATVDPEGTLDTLKGVTSFSGLRNWIMGYVSKDRDAERLASWLTEGHKSMLVDPDGDFREKWEKK